MARNPSVVDHPADRVGRRRATRVSLIRMGARALTICFEGFDAVVAQEAHLARGCFFVPVPDPAPEPFAEVLLCIEAPNHARAELEARVVQITPGRAMAVAFTDVAAARTKLAPLLDAATRSTEGRAGATHVL